MGERAEWKQNSLFGNTRGDKHNNSNDAKIVTGFVGLHKRKFFKILTHSVQTALCAVNLQFISYNSI